MGSRITPLIIMSSINIIRSFSTIIPSRTPMIKFRAGVVSSPAQVPAPQTPAGPAVYEWYEIPGKFRRPEIDDAEVEAINMGGGEKVWAQCSEVVKNLQV